MVSGGSPASWSATWAANTVAVQESLATKSVFGLMVKVVGPPVTTVSETFRVPELAQAIWNQFPVTFTGSLNVTVRFALVATCVAPFTGVVPLTDGAASVANVNVKSAAMVSGRSFVSA